MLKGGISITNSLLKGIVKIKDYKDLNALIDSNLVCREDRQKLFFIVLSWLSFAKEHPDVDNGLCDRVLNDDFFKCTEMDMILGGIRDNINGIGDKHLKYIEDILDLRINDRIKVNYFCIHWLISYGDRCDDFIHMDLIDHMKDKEFFSRLKEGEVFGEYNCNRDRRWVSTPSLI